MNYGKYNYDNQSGYLFTSIAQYKRDIKQDRKKANLRFRIVLENVSLVISDVIYFVLMKHGN